MTTSLLLERPALVGSQVPTREVVPQRVSEASADDAVALALSVGLVLDPWQERVIRNALGTDEFGRWAASTVGVDVSRQNGKGGILECRELAGLFLFGEQLIIHTAHLFPTALEAFRRIVGWIEGSPDLSRHVRRIIRSHGEEGVELRSGARLLFKARAHGGGRGFTGDVVILDEAMILSAETVSDLQPTMAARPNPQLWMTGSAGFATSVPWQGLRARALAGADGVAWVSWGHEVAEGADREAWVRELAVDRKAWARANPALGIRITERAIEQELVVMTPDALARERLGVWDPAPADLVDRKLPLAAWAARSDPRSMIAGSTWLAVDVAPDRVRSSIAVAGRRADGAEHVELIERRADGTGWLADRVAGLAGRWPVVGIVVDPAGPAGSVAEEIDRALAAVGLSLRVRLVTAREHAQACGQLVDRVTGATPSLWHLGQPELDASVKAAATRALGDTWLWARGRADEDISPLVAVTLARWGMDNLGSSAPSFALVLG